MARDGADLGEALDGLRATYARVQGGEPDFRAVRALGVAWSEETLGYLHQLSCEDPLTGLASLAHLRARLSEVYRIAEQGGTSTTTSHALVVLDLPLLARATVWEDAVRGDAPARHGWPRAHAVAFPGGETICQASPRRLVVVAQRSDLLAQTGGAAALSRARTRTRRAAGRGSGSRGCRRPTTGQRCCSTSSPAAERPAGGPGGAACDRRCAVTLGTSLAACAVATPRAGSPRTSSRSSTSATPTCRSLEPDCNVAPTKEVYAVVERPPSGEQGVRRRSDSCACSPGDWCRSGPRTPRSATG